ncbi:MAG: FAD:protein FMN transferase [Raoultibacter sp.]
MKTRRSKTPALRQLPSKRFAATLFGVIAFLVAATLMFSSCSAADQEKAERQFFAMDTLMTITAYGTDTETALDKAVARTQELEKLFAPGMPTSDIYRLNHTQPTPQVVSPETFAVAEQAQSISAATQGAFDISIFPAVEAWGFDTGIYRVPPLAELDKLVADIDYRRIDLDKTTSTIMLPERMRIDMGGIAKGYTGDALSALLQKEGVSSAVIDLGGNVSVVGTRPDKTPWKIGIKNPFDPSTHLATLSLKNGSVATTGTYERSFTDDAGRLYGHVLDTKTGCPVDTDLESVSVVSPQATRCDGFSTALFALGLDRALDCWRADPSFEAVFVTKDKDIYVTEGLKDRFTCTESDTFTQSVVTR